MRLIETSNLKTWADSFQAKGQLPYLVQRLILAVIQPQSLRMPSDIAVWSPGFDGIVENSQESLFVPKGQSVWEMGTEPYLSRKASKDFEKRSKDRAKGRRKARPAQKINRRKITFVFVTPRVWADSSKWVAKCKAKRIWRDVRVIDGVQLADWLEVADAVNLQFADELHIVHEKGLQTPKAAWDQWRHFTDPPVSEELAVLGRADQEKKLIGRLVAPPGTFTIRGHAPREAWGFALAVMQRHKEGERESLFARTVVANDEAVASRLRHLQNLIIVLKQARDQVSRSLSAEGCHVIVPLGNDAPLEENPIKLARPTHRPFVEALVRMGLPEEKAERAARECGLSVTVLQRQLHPVHYVRPHWSDENSAARLAPALLAGRWNDRSKADQAILQKLAGARDYPSVVAKLERFRRMDEPPLQKIGDMWTLTAPADAFQLTATHLNKVDLERFKAAFREVFGKIDPNVEMAPDERIYRDIKGARGHSNWLRDKMAETLLLIAVRADSAGMDCVDSPAAYADNVVRGLPGLNDDWRVLASLRDQYPHLMEAAPGLFLDSLERLIKAKPEDVRRLFAEGESVLAGAPMHMGLLSGLEIMAWSPAYMPRVALTLAQLARIDPGGRWMNRPSNSLRGIFLWWNPGTNASIQQRLDAIDLVLDQEPGVGWSLLSDLLSVPASFSFGTARPRWRDLGDLPEEVYTEQGQALYVSAIVDRALDRVGDDPIRWRAILNSLRAFSAPQRDKALALLDLIAQRPLPVDRRSALWGTLRDFIYQQRTFQAASWVLPGDFISRLETILPRLTPSDLTEQTRWLFDEWLPTLPSAEEDISQRQKRVEDLRQEAVREIFEARGVKGLVELGTNCRLPNFVVSAAAPLMTDLGSWQTFVEQAISIGEPGVNLAAYACGHARELHGDAWRAVIREKAGANAWPPGVTASLLLWWPYGMATWEEAERLGVATDYWRRKPVWRITGTPSEQTYQIDQLIRAGRAAAGFLPIAVLGSEGIPTEALVRMFDATFDELAKVQTAEEVRRLGLHSHYIRKFLDELRSREDLPRNELARREYRALPILGPLEARGLTIHEFMAKDPDFYIELVCHAFRPAHRNKGQDAELPHDVQARAHSAYTLLRGMQQLPGLDRKNELDRETLCNWVEVARKRAIEVDREVIADQLIGEILAHSPHDSQDGGWPHRAVRDLIEKLAADEVDRGLMIERYNMRGTYTKAMYEGGNQERALANQYRVWADISRARWPRMARVLEAIAANWEESAGREDTEAEQEKLG